MKALTVLAVLLSIIAGVEWALYRTDKAFGDVAWFIATFVLAVLPPPLLIRRTTKAKVEVATLATLLAMALVWVNFAYITAFFFEPWARQYAVNLQAAVATPATLVLSVGSSLVCVFAADRVTPPS